MKLQGIYFIRNIVNDKVYVGSSVNVRKRWVKHVCHLKKGTHVNVHLQSAWNKYGSDCFAFQVIEKLSVRNHLVEREEYWINVMLAYIPSCGYNYSQHADSPTRGKIPWNKGKKGKPLSVEAKAHLSNIHRGSPPAWAIKRNFCGNTEEDFRYTYG